jgi:adenine-specific DNA glycosylase
LAIGKNQPFLAIDANVERVMSRFYGIDEINPRIKKLKIKSLMVNGLIRP